MSKTSAGMIQDKLPQVKEKELEFGAVSLILFS